MVTFWTVRVPYPRGRAHVYVGCAQTTDQGRVFNAVTFLWENIQNAESTVSPAAHNASGNEEIPVDLALASNVHAITSPSDTKAL